MSVDSVSKSLADLQSSSIICADVIDPSILEAVYGDQSVSIAPMIEEIATPIEAVSVEPEMVQVESLELEPVRDEVTPVPQPLSPTLTQASQSLEMDGSSESTVAEATPAEAAPVEAAQAEATPSEPEGPHFSKLGLSKSVLSAVQSSGYDIPTSIQNDIIPHVLAGRDVLAQSQTGTGKTAAFALPILSKLEPKIGLPQVLVLAPTRELAMQVSKSFETYASAMPHFSVLAIYGGQDYEPQLRQLRRGVHVVVGTPGRVIDHVRRGTLDLSGLKVLVLDEADEMLNMGFLEDVQFVLEQTPPDRQIALFSATLPGPIRDIAETYLKDPVKITIGRQTMTAESIRQRALFVSPKDKMEALKRFLEAEATDGVIVFTKTKDATITVADQLIHSGLKAVALNGDMPQKVRERAIDQLKSGRLDILVATDVAARGLDVPRISHVFNFDLPHDSESYVHRIGRTGRAGRAGEAIIFLTHAQRGKLRTIERLTKQPIEVVDMPTADQINSMRVEKFKQRITDVIGARDVSLFTKMINEYAQETGKPIELIAAALAHITQNGRPFFLKDSIRERSTSRENARGERLERGDRPERGGDRNERFERGGRESFDGESRPERKGRRMNSTPADGMTRYRVEVGWRDGVKPGNLVGAIANEAGIDGEYIGPIQIENEFSFVDLPEGMPADIYQTLRNTWVSGKKLNLSLIGDNAPTADRSDTDFKPRKPHAKREHIRSGAPHESARFEGAAPGKGKFKAGKPKFIVGKGKFAGAKSKPKKKP